MRIRIDNVTDERLAPAHQVPSEELDELRPRLLAIQEGSRKEAAAGYGALVEHERAWTKSHERAEDVRAVAEAAALVRERADAFVTVGIGGSDLAARTIHSVLGSSQHDLLPEEERGGAPEVYFCGDSFDPKELAELLGMLRVRGLLTRTVFNIVSKSGTTAETVAAFLVIRSAVQSALREAKRDQADYAKQFVVTTGLNEGSALFRLNRKLRKPFLAMLPVPEGVGGRFSFGSPVGLLTLAVGADTRRASVADRLAEAVRGMRDAESDARLDPGDDRNVGFRLASVTYLTGRRGKSTLVFYPYAKQLKALGEWYTQLSSESIQERGEGQNIIATCGPTGNHSLLNGIINGPRDKLVVFVRVGQFDESLDQRVPHEDVIEPKLASLSGFTLGELQNISWESTATNLRDNSVPNCTIDVAKVDEHYLFKLFYALAVQVAVEGELRGLGRLVYEQSAVEGYKSEFRRIIGERSKGV